MLRHIRGFKATYLYAKNQKKTNETISRKAGNERANGQRYIYRSLKCFLMLKRFSMSAKRMYFETWLLVSHYSMYFHSLLDSIYCVNTFSPRDWQIFTIFARTSRACGRWTSSWNFLVLEIWQLKAGYYGWRYFKTILEKVLESLK